MSLQSDLLAIQEGYRAALVADAASPQPSYTINGKTVDRDRWRQSLLEQIRTIQKDINALAPYIVSTRVVT